MIKSEMTASVLTEVESDVNMPDRPEKIVSFG